MENEKVLYKEVEEENERFEEINTPYLSKSNLLREQEVAFKQTISKSRKERVNPNQILPFLDKLRKKFYLELDKPTSPSLFKENVSGSFEMILDAKCGTQLQKASLRAYIKLVIINRRGIAYHDINDQYYTFDIKDVYQLGGIQASMFHDASQLPSTIISRMKINIESYHHKTEQFLKQWQRIENQLNHHYQTLNHVMADSESGKDEAEQKVTQIQKKINHCINELELLSMDIDMEVAKTPRYATPEILEVNMFIKDFVNYGVRIEADVFNSNRCIKQKDGSYTTTDTDIIDYFEPQNVYIQDENMTWTNAQNIYKTIFNQLLGNHRYTMAQMDDAYKGLINLIKTQSQVNVFTFNENAIFVKNGVIKLTFNKDGSVAHQFIHKNQMSNRAMMYHYATNYRLSVVYDPNVKDVFNDNEIDEPVTPDYIFGALGQRGYENDEDEAKARANLIMQYTLKVLMPHKDVGTVRDSFLYFYNASNSGKSTFMNMLSNIVGNRHTTNLQTDDLSNQKGFGLINIKDKRLVLVDEANSSNQKIKAERIKMIATKDELEVDVKGKDYQKFTPTAEMIFASNHQPKFDDESGGTERRLLAFQLENGYNGQEGLKDMSFIKHDYIQKDTFQSACIRWVLNHVNVDQPVPKSVTNDTLSIINSEDDVQVFIKNRMRQVIDEPLFIAIDHLYELYRLDTMAKSGNDKKVRNKTNFKKALMKVRNGVYELKGLDHSNVDTINRLLYVYGALFEDYHMNLNQNSINNPIVKSFMDFCDERSQRLNRFYNQVIKIVNKEIKLYEVSRSRTTMIAIIPDNEIYDDTISANQLVDIVKSQKNGFLESALKEDKNVELIRKNQIERLPFFMRNTIPKSFSHYSMSGSSKQSFKDLIKYQ